MKYLIVEHTFNPPLNEEDLKGISERLGPCLEQHNIKPMRFYLSDDRSRMICAFEAPDAESVRIAHRTAKVEFDRVWVGEAFIRKLEEVTE
jgi:hypothetical protein